MSIANTSARLQRTRLDDQPGPSSSRGQRAPSSLAAHRELGVALAQLDDEARQLQQALQNQIQEDPTPTPGDQPAQPANPEQEKRRLTQLIDDLNKRFNSAAGELEKVEIKLERKKETLDRLIEEGNRSLHQTSRPTSFQRSNSPIASTSKAASSETIEETTPEIQKLKETISAESQNFLQCNASLKKTGDKLNTIRNVISEANTLKANFQTEPGKQLTIATLSVSQQLTQQKLNEPQLPAKTKNLIEKFLMRGSMSSQSTLFRHFTATPVVEEECARINDSNNQNRDVEAVSYLMNCLRTSEFHNEIKTLFTGLDAIVAHPEQIHQNLEPGVQTRLADQIQSNLNGLLQVAKRLAANDPRLQAQAQALEQIFGAQGQLDAHFPTLLAQGFHTAINVMYHHGVSVPITNSYKKAGLRQLPTLDDVAHLQTRVNQIKEIGRSIVDKRKAAQTALKTEQAALAEKRKAEQPVVNIEQKIPQTEQAEKEGRPLDVRRAKAEQELQASKENFEKLNNEYHEVFNQLHQAQKDLSKNEVRVELKNVQTKRGKDFQKRKDQRIRQLKKQISDLSNRLMNESALINSHDPAAWARVRERHLGLTTEQIKSRVAETGVASVYADPAHLLTAVRQINADALRRFEPLIAANSEAEFTNQLETFADHASDRSQTDRGAYRYLDARCEHRDVIGHGFRKESDGNLSERRQALASRYSLAWSPAQNRVVISHLHPVF